jgi:hypothetical protein
MALCPHVATEPKIGGESIRVESGYICDSHVRQVTNTDWNFGFIKVAEGEECPEYETS